MEKTPRLALMIHDLNPWGGQDRSMLEIAWQLNKEFALQIHSFTLQGKEHWPAMEHIPYQARFKKPIILKYLNYQSSSYKNLKLDRPTLVQSTGTASLISDVVQVQFIHHSWQKIAETLPMDKNQTFSPLKSSYHKMLNLYKLQMEKSLYTPEKHYIAISHSIKKELMEHFSIPADKISIIYHGVDSVHFFPHQDDNKATMQRKDTREKLGLKVGDFVLLHVGALNSRKGLFQSIRVLSYLKKNGFDHLKLLAVGQGDQENLKQLTKQWDVEDLVHIAPHNHDIRSFYWASDCFFFPSFYEPFGLVILEAMACGLPVAVSQSCGGAELINHNQNGILFDPHDKPEKIANQLLPIIRNEAKDMAQQARKTSLHHNWDFVGKQYRDFYRQRLQEITQ